MSLEAEFLSALYPQQRLTPSQWAERHRILGPDESSEPGSWSNDRTPYLVDFMDAVGGDVEEIVLLKGAQIGYSEACRNLIGWWVDQQPGPILVVLPDQKSADNWRDERLAPLMKHTEAIAQHATGRAWDATQHRVKFDSCTLYLAWAGSSQSLKSRPIRYLVLEEPDEYPAHSGAGGDPVAKALKRVTTYADKGLARVIVGGTPTTRSGNIWKRWEACSVHLHPWVPCPHCGQYQVLQWSQVKWPKDADAKLDTVSRSQRAERVERDSLAYYECEGCKKPIRDHHKPEMLRKIRWADDDQVVNAKGEVVGPATKSRRVGMRITSLYSPWVTFSRLACEWLMAQGDPAALMDFFNQRLAECFEEQRAKIETPLIAAKAKAAGPAKLPDWAVLILATADVQMNGIYFVVRAWGHELRSRLLHCGVVTGWDELRRETLERSFGAYTPERLVVDNGFRKPEVDQFALRDTARINTAKGLSTYTGPIAEAKLERATGILVWNVNTMQAKDRLHSLIHDPDATRWLPHELVGPDYCEQMSSEHKVWDPKEKMELWQKRTSHAQNHYWDCEAMQVAVASLRGCVQPAPRPQPAAAQQQPQPRTQQSGWLDGRPDGWIS